MGYYYMVKFRKGKKEWSEKFIGSGYGKKGQTPQQIRSWVRRIGKVQKQTYGGAKIVSIKKVTVSKQRKKRSMFPLLF